MPSHPPWWSSFMPELVSKRELMPNVEKLQSMYVRYKCQPEAQITNAGWDLATSQRYADQLAAEEQQAYVREESLLYNGLAPTSISLRIIEAPAEFAVPVKQDRRLTPNFRIRAEVGFNTRCSFPLTLKVYVITQQEKDSVPEWVPDDFLDPELPQRKPITELKGTTVITHHFEAALEPSEEQLAQQQQQKQQQQQLAAQAAHMLMNGNPDSGMAGVNAVGDIDPQVVDQVIQEGTRTGAIDTATAATLTAALLSGTTTPLDALSTALGMGAAANTTPQVAGTLTHDYEFAAVELVKPTRMNKVYLVFACSILEQDLMFVVYNIPTVGICRAEQRAKACQKLNISFQELGGIDYAPDAAGGYSAGKQNGANAAAAAAAAAYSVQQQQQQHSRKRVAGQAGWNDGLMLPDGLMGGDMAAAAAAAMAAGGDPNLAMPMQVDGSFMAGLSAPDVASLQSVGLLGSMGLLQQAAAGGASMLPPGDGAAAAAAAAEAAAASNAAVAAAAAAAAAAAPPAPRSRPALRKHLQQEYQGAGLTRRLTSLDLQALEYQAGFPANSSGGEVAISQEQWEEFLNAFRDRLKLLRLIANVWNREDPCFVCGFDMDPLGAAQALASQPEGTAICCFSLEHPNSLVLICKQKAPDASTGEDGLLQAVVQADDLMERRVETWLRDLQAATHLLDVYRNKRVDKRVLLGLNKFTRLRAMDRLDAYDDILI